MDARRLGVLVGVDGSESGERALDWAVADAAARGAELTVVHVVDLPRIADVPLSSDLVAAADRRARANLDKAVVRVRQAGPVLSVRAELARGNPATELLALAAGADEVVLGSRGHGGFSSLLLGSTAAQVAAHAPGPVVVVRGTATAGGPVVVGVDGSERGEAALDYGFTYAARHGLPLRAVHVHPDYVATLPYLTVPIDVRRVREDSVRLLRQAVDQWSAKFPDVPADTALDEGGAAHRLTVASEGASLLVVGCRGHGGFAGVLLGSVSQAAVRHAHCPVAVGR